MKRAHFFAGILLSFSLISGCASLPDNSSKSVTHALPEDTGTRIAEVFDERASSHPQGQSAFHLLGNGLDAFVARALFAQMADKTIDSQYYLVHDDLVSRLYIDQLIKAADRGVRVRFLVDDMDEGNRDFKLAVMDYHPNIEVRVFNPFGRNTGKTVQFLTGFGKQTRRAHNKSFTVDNIAIIVGGRNIGNEYFDAEADMDFADLDVLGIGPVAKEVSASFDEYWNHELSYPISLLVDQQPTEADYQALREKFDKYIAAQQDSVYLESLRNSRLIEMMKNQEVDYYWAESRVYADSPNKLLNKTGADGYQMLADLRPYLEQAKESVFIISPYFVPGKKGTEFLVGLSQRGVDVRIVTNSLTSTDVSVVHAGYARYRKPLLRGGVELYEINKETMKKGDATKNGGIGRSKSSLHAKAFVVDGKKAFIGSLNLDPRSVIQNTEIGVVIDSSELSQQMLKGLEKNLEKATFRLALEEDSEGVEHTTWHGLVDGKQTRLTREPYAGFWQRFFASLLRLMPIESQI
jgi:putative cardiolipin synthase